MKRFELISKIQRDKKKTAFMKIFQKIKTEMRVSLAPVFIGRPLDGVKDYLNTFIMK